MGKHGPNHDLTRPIAQFPAPLGRKYPPPPPRGVFALGTDAFLHLSGGSRGLILDPSRWQFFLRSSAPPFLRVLLVFPVAMVSQSTPKRGQKGEIFIGVIGVTGGGKTTFISRATGRSDLEIGYGIDSCKSNEAHRAPPPSIC